MAQAGTSFGVSDAFALMVNPGLCLLSVLGACSVLVSPLRPPSMDQRPRTRTTRCDHQP
ncbi:8-amino-7-oxononanoate synthase [Cutibacterium acnes]|nr:8-amino-7-oxononanoate synthase [Cutibacterium acnes]REB18278.1 8-amino-7-oxononanoate synthase [Cutibacterium acnes]TLG15183.1 8-amino-7-oxononanoate synthase [Cutibacterium acnes]TLG16768.1 8-amino-7-oxononanoate synthase [Cutibacterium acnes]TLG24462.1 8-amino-7-oxononanoate synthase [Cutibacterium acnes]